MKDHLPTFSVVIPCLNEQGYIGLLLEDIIRQSAQPKEVIIADSRSDDKTVEIAKSFQDRLPLKTVTSNVRSPGAGRNTGAKQATADYIFFIDADTRLPDTAFEQTIQATKGGKIDYVTPLFSTPGHHPIDQLAVKTINWDIRFGLSASKRLPGIGGYMCVRRRLHEDLGGFEVRRGKSEDLEYLTRMKERDASYVVLKKLLIETSNRRMIKYGRVVAALYFIPAQWRINRYMIKPMLKKFGRDKSFGQF